MEGRGDDLCQRALSREAGGPVVSKELGIQARGDLNQGSPNTSSVIGVKSKDLFETIIFSNVKGTCLLT